MSQLRRFAAALMLAACAGCIALSFGDTTNTTPTLAQELRELKDSAANGKITPDEFEVAKNLLLSKPRGEAGPQSATTWASHTTAK